MIRSLAFAVTLLSAAATLFLNAASARAAQAAAPAAFEDQRRWNSIADLLRAVEPAYGSNERRAAEQAVAAANPSALLEWSGEAGLLLWVRFQVAEGSTGTPPGAAAKTPLGPPVSLGVGASPFNSAAAGFYDPPLLTSPADGMREARNLGFFVWAAEENGRIRYRRFTLAESRALEASLDPYFADPLLAAKDRRARTMRIIEGVRAKLTRRHGVRAPMPAIDTARSAYAAARTALDNGERARLDWAAWVRQSDTAFGLVDSYKNILTLPGLRAQAYALSRSGLRHDIRRAATPAALQLVLGGDRDRHRGLLANLDVAALCRAELAAYDDAFAAFSLSGPDRAFVRRLLPTRTDTPCRAVSS